MQPLTFITLSNSSESSDELRDALAGSERAHLLADCHSLEQMLADVTRLGPSAAVITLGQDNSEKGFALIKLLAAASHDTAIITAARDASPALILGSMRAGACEFIQLPIIADEFRTVMDRVAEFCAGRENSSKRNR